MKLFNKISYLTLITALFLSYSASISHAQESPPQPSTYLLEGDVIDAQSEALLPDAAISVVGKEVSTVSNQDGKFKLEDLPSGEHTIKVELEGYQTWEKKIALEEDTKLTIKLIPDKE